MADNTRTAPEQSLRSQVIRLGDDIESLIDIRNRASGMVGKARAALTEAEAELDRKQSELDRAVRERAEYERAADLVRKHSDDVISS